MTEQPMPRILVTPLADRAAILGTVLLWGTQIPALHALGARWDPFTLNIIRYLLAAAAFALILRAVPARAAGRLPPRRGLMLGALMAGFGILFTTGAVIGDPVATATVAALMPLTASLVNWAMIGTRPAGRTVAALAFVVPGAALATPAGGGAGSHPVLGILLMVSAQATWALYSLQAQAWTPGWSQIARTAVSVRASLPFHAAAFAAVAALGTARAAPADAMTLDATLIVAVTLGPLVLGVVLWNTSVARLGLPVAALHLNLIPVVGIALAALLGAWPSAAQLAGAAIVVAAMVVLRPRAPAGAPSRQE
jgi:drug/metabolite transporter (DMT)-like permease